MTEPKTHFIASMDDFGDEAACGDWEPPRMSGDWKDVTCGRCKRSRRYRAAARGEPMLMAGYRKPYQGETNGN